MSQPTGIASVSVSTPTATPVEGVPAYGAYLAKLRRALPWVMLVALFVSMLWMRVSQPSDLHDDDQSKTMAYTVDIIRNHIFAMPRDMYRQPATKPPMYNWLTIPFIYAFQSYEAWVFKIPAVLAAIATCGLILVAARTMLSSTTGRSIDLPQQMSGGLSFKSLPVGVGIVAVAIFLGSQPAYKMMYLCRPDMLLTAFLTGAWVFGTMALLRDSGSTMRPAALFWICIAGASLTKGPPALAALIYVFIAARLFGGGWHTLRRLHWKLALPLLLLPLFVWAAIGLYQSGIHFVRVLFIQELASRIAGGGPEGTEAKPWWQMPVWFFQRFGPWSLLAMIVVISLPKRKWTQHVLAPVVIWIVLVLIFFSIPGGKRADYLLPIYPPAAIAAAFFLVVAGSLLGVTPAKALIAIGLTMAYMTTHLDRSRVPSSDTTEAFVAKIAPIIKKDPMVVVMVAGYQPMLPLLGRFDGARPIKMDPEKDAANFQLWQTQLRSAKWVVMPVNTRWPNAHAVSEPIPAGITGRPVKLALYRISEPGAPTISQVINLDRRRRVGVTSAEIQQNRQPAATAPATTSSTRPSR